ncbi:MAG: hypothetical protein K6E91_08760 [Butyrivibrio sp.]|nr:hypothetical protein [Butyrivibrio sp.]
MLEKDRMSLNQEQFRTGNVMGDYVNVNKVDESFATNIMKNPVAKSRQKNAQDKEEDSKWSELDVKGLYDRIEIPAEMLDNRAMYDFRNFHTAVVRNSSLSDSQLMKRQESARKKAQLGRQARDIDRTANEKYSEKYGNGNRPGNEAVLNRIRRADISDMTYSSDEEFCEKYAKNYELLRMASEYIDRVGYDDLGTMDDDNLSKLLFMKQVKADYDNRLQMMTSNYFALLTKSDIEQLQKKNGINVELLGQKNANELEKYLDLVKNVNRNEIFGKGMNADEALSECRSELVGRNRSNKVDLLKRTPANRVRAEADMYSKKEVKNLDEVDTERPSEDELFENEELVKNHQTMDSEKLRFSEDNSKAEEKLGDEDSVVKRMRLGKVLDEISQPDGATESLKKLMS